MLVDYAHTPDSVRNVLQTARGFTEGRLIAVLGCGGDRDRGKRPLMGREAEALADRVIITSDNPRSEDPEAIIADILAGSSRRRASVSSPTGGRPSRAALSEARPDDVVLILGKGHESGQEFADRRSPSTTARWRGASRGAARGRAMIPLTAEEAGGCAGTGHLAGARYER